MGVVVRRYIDILIIIITFPYSTCISSFFGSSIPTFLFIFCSCENELGRSKLKVRGLSIEPLSAQFALIYQCMYM